MHKIYRQEPPVKIYHFPAGGFTGGAQSGFLSSCVVNSLYEIIVPMLHCSYIFDRVLLEQLNSGYIYCNTEKAMERYSYLLWMFRHLIRPIGCGFLFWKAVSIPIWDFSNETTSLLFIVCATVLILAILFFVYTDKSIITWDRQAQVIYLHGEEIPLKKIKKIIVGRMPKQSASDFMPAPAGHSSGRFYNPLYLQLDDNSIKEATFDMDFTTKVATIIPVHFDDKDMYGLWKLNKIIGYIGGFWFFALGLAKIVKMFQ